MTEVGAGWLKTKKDRDGQEVLVQGRKVLNISCVLDIPFLGKCSFMALRETEKKNDRAPDYRIVYFPDDGKGKPAARAEDNPPDDTY